MTSFFRRRLQWQIDLYVNSDINTQLMRVTLKDVAATVGLSVSCTARALKGRPGFSDETYRKVRMTADELGYRPDPMLGALSAYRQAQKPKAFQGTMAFLMTGNEVLSPKSEAFDLFKGAEARAESLGYRLECFHIGPDRRSHRHIWKVLQARGIHGGLIRSFPLPIEDIHIPFDRFIGIDLFSSPHLNGLPTVSSYHAQSMEVVLEELVKRGYRHPALILAEELSKYLRHGWWMAFTANAHRFSETSTFFSGKRPMSWKQQDQWMKKRGVDVLVYCTSENFIPKDVPGGRGVGIVCMDLLDPECGIAGILQNRRQAGATAIEWLHSMLINAQIGWERIAHAVMIPGTWQPEKTLKETQTGDECRRRMLR